MATPPHYESGKNFVTRLSTDIFGPEIPHPNYQQNYPHNYPPQMAQPNYPQMAPPNYPRRDQMLQTNYQQPPKCHPHHRIIFQTIQTHTFHKKHFNRHHRIHMEAWTLL